MALASITFYQFPSLVTNSYCMFTIIISPAVSKIRFTLHLPDIFCVLLKNCSWHSEISSIDMLSHVVRREKSQSAMNRPSHLAYIKGSGSHGIADETALNCQDYWTLHVFLYCHEHTLQFILTQPLLKTAATNFFWKCLLKKNDTKYL